MSEKKMLFLPRRVPVSQQDSSSDDEDYYESPQKHKKRNNPVTSNIFSTPHLEVGQVIQNVSTNCLDTIPEGSFELSTPAYSTLNRLSKSSCPPRGNDSAYSSITTFGSCTSKLFNRPLPSEIGNDMKAKTSLLDRYGASNQSNAKSLHKENQCDIVSNTDFLNAFPTPNSKSPTLGPKVLQESSFHNSRLISPTSYSFTNVNNDYKSQKMSHCHASPLQNRRSRPSYEKHCEGAESYGGSLYNCLTQPSPPQRSSSIRNIDVMGGKDRNIFGIPVPSQYDTLSSNNPTTQKASLTGKKDSTTWKGSAIEQHRSVSPVSWLKHNQHKGSSERVSQRENVNSMVKVFPKEQAVPTGAAEDNQKPQPQNIIVVKNVEYTVITMIGKGGFSKVYEVTSPQGQNFALKVVTLTEDQVKAGLMQEIHLLEQFRGSPYIVQMEAYEFRKNVLYVVMEKGETDLAVYMKKERLKPNAIKFLWSELLAAVKCIHDKGIVHNDLKPANFLLVGDHIKVIDFGIAAKIQKENTSVFMDSPTGTLNYMSPESVQENEKAGNKIKVNRKSDVWSLGCILYSLVYGRTPFQHFRGIPAKIMAIVDPRQKIEFEPLDNPQLLDVLMRCLNRNLVSRPSVEDLLVHPYLCEPFSEDALIAIFRQLTPRRRLTMSKFARELADKS